MAGMKEHYKRLLPHCSGAIIERFKRQNNRPRSAAAQFTTTTCLSFVLACCILFRVSTESAIFAPLVMLCFNSTADGDTAAVTDFLFQNTAAVIKSDLASVSMEHRRVQAAAETTSTDSSVDTMSSTLPSLAPPLPTPPPPPPQPLPRPIQLLRIPKAGSSSFSAFLRLQYNCTTTDHPPGDCTRQNRHTCPLVQGCTNHLTIPDWQRVANAVAHATSNDTPHHTKEQQLLPLMVTFVRDPISRYQSAYRYTGHHGLGTHGNITLHTLLFPEYNNVQTSYLARRPIGTWQIKHGNQARTAPPDPSTLPNATEWQRRWHDASALINATQYLPFVGLVEYWNDSLRLFCRMYLCTRLEDSLQAKPERQQRNKEAKTAAVSGAESDADQAARLLAKQKAVKAAEREAVRQANAIDLQLYALATQRFCRDLAVYQSDAQFMATLQPETLQLCFSSR